MAETLPPFTVSPEYQAKIAAGEVPAPAPVPTPKSGIKTSEFWLHLAALIVPAVIQALSNSGDATLLVAAQIAASIYTLARTLLKKAA